MSVTLVTRALVALALAVGLAGCTPMKSASLFDLLGGMDQVRSLSNAFVNNVSSDPRTSKLLATTNLGALKTKVSDQICALAGGGCPAPLTNAQISAAAKKVDAPTSSALTDSLKKALDTVKAAPAVKEGMTSLLGPQLGGIVAGLL